MELVQPLVEKVKRVHLNYNMITSLYMMEPMERTIINCFLLLMTSLMMYSSWVYLPHYTLKLFRLTGLLPSHEEDFQELSTSTTQHSEF